ncbi:MT-A70-domain-containing protein [Fistulina hepatica ATCC 64428]|uniref:mRNA m(6)A methyltransferase n=1 Tax=Fistulina hepatica ATCC 64428 TaxID=1128425 RepID=A0A0D7A4X7_9AGAR|nr:MT-A70-domain-containing protein [Fistulina hepatica ATCC 64428]
MDLLTRVVSYKPPTGLLTSAAQPRFRLTDLSLFESVLETLARVWDQGTILLSRDNDGVTVIDVRLDTPRSGANTFGTKKRKRVVDEDADSAAGNNCDDDEDYTSFEGSSTLGHLNKELRQVYGILQRCTAKGRLLAEQLQSSEERFEPICPHITKDECIKARRLTGSMHATFCDRVHFRPLIRPHTDQSLGHCSYLNTCYSEPTYAQSPSIPPFPGTAHSHGIAPPNSRGSTSLPSGLGAGGRGKEKAPCRYLHYEIDWDESSIDKRQESVPPRQSPHRLELGLGPPGPSMRDLPPQWINCDVRKFDYSVLGKFHAIMADPPWDIHMSLPYGTMTDDEMRSMPIPMLQDEGILFLWVTGRAMEVGRECLRVWGYTRVDEVVWIKTNQLQRVIRTGRTGHWLNHTKEHMLVGIKTNVDPATGVLKYPSWVNRGLDTDIIVSEVRETSRKPEEVYGLIERMCPGGRKIEIFGRKHNTRPGWLTLGNQLGDTDQIFEEDLAARIRERYPERHFNS